MIRRFAQLAYLSTPVHALASPIFSREMAVAGRRWTTYALRGLYVAGVLAVISIVLLGNMFDVRNLTTTESISRVSVIAPQLAMALMWIQFASLVLLGPLLTSGAICDEKVARTLPALLTTPLTSVQIVFGKLASRFVHMGVLVCLLVPILLLLRVYGGYPTRFVLTGSAIALSVGFLGSSIGLMFSIWHKRSWIVTIYALLVMALYIAVPMMFVAFFAAGMVTGSPGQQQALGVALSASPVLALFYETNAAAQAVPFPFGFANWAWAVSSGVAVALGWLIGLFSSVLLRRVMLAEAHGWQAGSGGFVPGLRVRGKRGGAAKRSKSRRTSRTVGGLFDMPVLWREMRLPIAQNRVVFTLSVLLVGGLFSLLYVRSDVRDEDIHILITVLVLVMHLLASSAMTTGAITHEREARSLDVLLSTPMSMRAIVLQKYFGNLRRLAIGPVFLLLHFSVFAIAGIMEFVTAVHVFAISFGFAGLLAGTGLFFGSVLNKPLAASIGNTCFAIGLFLGLPILITILYEALGLLGSYWLGDLALWMNPVYLSVTSIAHDFKYRPDTVDFGMSRNPIPFGVYSVRVLFWSAGAFLAGTGAALLASVRLKRSFRRAE